MELIALHSIMSRKKYHYFYGKTNDADNNLYLSFSTLHNGRGDSIDIRLGGVNNDIIFLLDNIKTEYKQITDNGVFQLLEELH